MLPLAQQFGGTNGFLGTRGSLMLDVVFLAMFAVVPLLALSIYVVKYRRAYDLHKKLQIVMGTVLLLAVVAFEVDMQFLTVWEERAEPSPYFSSQSKWSCPAGISLLVHLMFAVPTFVLWIVVMVQALRLFASPPKPGKHSLSHMLWGKLAAVGMVGTAVTGWIFYYLAFAAV